MKVEGCFARYEEVVAALDKGGAFLTLKDRDGNLNTMTIGWAMLGVIWHEPVFMVAVRHNRHTYKLIENADSYTVTVPLVGMKKELMFCGTHSGSKIDKFKESGLSVLPSKIVDSPILDVSNARHYECKIVQVSPMDQKRLDPRYDKSEYQDRSYHTYYFGEIVACYDS